MYDICWKSESPGYILFLIDLSASMEEGNKIECVTKSIYFALSALVEASEEKNIAYVSIYGYNFRVIEIWKNYTIEKIKTIIDNPKIFRDNLSYQILGAQASLSKALIKAKEDVEEWVYTQYEKGISDVPAPIVINLTDAIFCEDLSLNKSEKPPMLEAAKELMSISTKDGNVLLFNILYNQTNNNITLRYPNVLPKDVNQQLLYNASSIFSPGLIMRMKEREGLVICDDARAIIYNETDVYYLARLLCDLIIKNTISKYNVKAFQTHKRGETKTAIHDRIALDIEKGRFALADGVSNSYLPFLWAEILVDSYISVSDTRDLAVDKLSQLFINKKEEYLARLDKNELVVQKAREKYFKVASSTFLGLEIENNVLRWKLIGDSCLFILPQDGVCQCYCSNTISVDNEGHIFVDFSENTDQICADGTIAGMWQTGSLELKNGYVVMMSDAMSKWFLSELNNEGSPLEKLLALDSEESFEMLVEQEFRLNKLDSDDESVILIEINNNGQIELPYNDIKKESIQEEKCIKWWQKIKL